MLSRCRNCQHGKLLDGAPIDHGDCVNVPHICELCEFTVSETSWTRAAWDEHQAKTHAAEALSHQGRLFEPESVT